METTVVTEVCADMPTVGGMMLCQDRGAGVAGDSDSRAPVFKVTNTPETGDVELLGVLWAYHKTERKGTCSPMDQIQHSDELGSLKTCALEVGC